MKPRPNPWSPPSTPAHGALLAALALTFLTFGCSATAETVDEAERLAEVLELEPGMRVADVGAGRGRWSLEIARRIGPTGRLWSTEIDPDDVEDLADRFERRELPQAKAVLGSITDTGLPDGCCDVVFLRLVYHHFTDPAAMRASLRRALRPGGRLVIMDIEIQEDWGVLEGVPDRGGHGIAQQQLIDELSKDGFEVVAEHPDWPGDDDHYLVVFQPCG